MNDDLVERVPEIWKERFLQLVDQLARLRDLQYQKDEAKDVLQLAKKVVARNLPSNLLRAAAIFVDHLYGFPPGHGAFCPPKWVRSRNLLPEGERGSLGCSGFKEVCALEEGDLVVLVGDVQSDVAAGMAGIIREMPSEDEEDEMYLVEFGEPEESSTTKVQVHRSLLRTPRPGDLLEGFRL